MRAPIVFRQSDRAPCSIRAEPVTDAVATNPVQAPVSVLTELVPAAQASSAIDTGMITRSIPGRAAQRPRFGLLASFILITLSACGSPTTHYHTLAAIPPSQTTVPSATRLRVGEVNLPPLLDRQSLVTRTGATELSVDAQDRWAAPLDQMIQQTLTEDLTARLGADHVLAADATVTPPGTRTLTLSIRRFIANPDGTVVLDADWALQGGRPPGMPRHEVVTVSGVPARPDPVVMAMSQALAGLADRIAAGA